MNIWKNKLIFNYLSKKLLNKKSIFRRFIQDCFHVMYYHSGDLTMGSTYWNGIPLSKCPLDLWLYQELIFKIKPELIIETGTALGGSSNFFGDLLEINKKGLVVSVDIRKNKSLVLPEHNRVKYLIGSSIDPQIISQIYEYVKNCSGPILVSLDSCHEKKHVLEELNLYSHFVTPGSYLIVEDTNINGHPVLPEFKDGPFEAIEEFMKLNELFIEDKALEKYLISFNKHGYLLRK